MLSKQEKIHAVVLYHKVEKDAAKMSLAQYNWMKTLMYIQSNGINLGANRTSKHTSVLDKFCKIISAHYCSCCTYDNKCCKIEDSEELCYYFKEGKCTIYKIRPLTCRNFVCDTVSSQQVHDFFKHNGLEIAIFDNKLNKLNK
jgi:Fe-S-cluster containining protein